MPIHDVLKDAGTSFEGSPEDMLDALERLNDELVARIERAGAAVVDPASQGGAGLRPVADAKKRYDEELLPKLEAVRNLVARKSPMARNALEDAAVLLRELHITATANVVTAPF